MHVSHLIQTHADLLCLVDYVSIISVAEDNLDDVSPSPNGFRYTPRMPGRDDNSLPFPFVTVYSLCFCHRTLHKNNAQILHSFTEYSIPSPSGSVAVTKPLVSSRQLLVGAVAVGWGPRSLAGAKEDFLRFIHDDLHGRE